MVRSKWSFSVVEFNIDKIGLSNNYDLLQKSLRFAKLHMDRADNAEKVENTESYHQSEKT